MGFDFQMMVGFLPKCLVAELIIQHVCVMCVCVCVLFLHCSLNLWLRPRSQRPEDIALGHHVRGWASYTHSPTHTHIDSERGRERNAALGKNPVCYLS